jgi:hypothetical protein
MAVLPDNHTRLIDLDSPKDPLRRIWTGDWRSPVNGVARLGIIGAVLVAAGGGLLLKQATAPGRVSSGEIPFDPAAPIELEPVRNACGGTMADKRLAVLAGILSAVAAVSPLRGDTEPAEVRAVLF